ncbi:hypothetical protein D9M70_526080 [compost metagenome]
MDDEEDDVVLQRVPEVVGPALFPEQCLEIGKPDEGWLSVNRVVQREPERLDQRQDHHRRIDQEGREQEDEDVPALRPPCGRLSVLH